MGKVFLAHTEPLNTNQAYYECRSIVHLSIVTDHIHPFMAIATYIIATSSMIMRHVTKPSQTGSMNKTSSVYLSGLLEVGIITVFPILGNGDKCWCRHYFSDTVLLTRSKRLVFIRSDQLKDVSLKMMV